MIARRHLGVLRRYAELPDDEFLRNAEALGAAKYAFVVMIEAAVSIASHLCAKKLSKAPISQRDGFLILGDAGLLPQDLAGELGRMAGFRNLLVHGYGQVDNRLMLAIMREHLADVESFISGILELDG